ncbi:probable E3 ubiquitin-protein ligase makorin-2 [Balaenoptera musculus]|uniref:E3 ubiquitin-protein ligase makorin-2 n=1 Tax=Balaenoptera musculus TaxID=9771 RepID=A0A8B8XES5_BALMU|nr:probable E3 ubiquitin-protein ligase makorin-2 [Balaenoptera musculus]
MSTKQVTCRYFMRGMCREGNQCLFSHDLANSKPSTICKYYQKGCCAYGTCCRYDHTRPSAAAGGAMGTVPHGVPSLGFHSPHPPSYLTASIVKTNLHEPGKREKRTLVLRDRNLSGMAEEKTCPSVVSNPGGCSDLQNSPELKPHSYLEAISSGLDNLEASISYSSEQQLCPYAAAGECRFGDACVYLHGEVCEICRLQVLHPFDPEHRKAHEKICMSTFEHEMEKAFAFQASQDKVCSICMEVILEKASASERRFGILSNCNHTYCLSCIRQWRYAKQFENPIIKSCPECHVISEFVIPSVYWVEDQNKKNELIEAFKQGMGKKVCKYFEQGKGTCPFGSKCLYRHAYPDGRLAEPEKPRKQLSSEGTVRFFNSVRLWDFIENRESQHVHNTEDVDMTELGDLFMHLSGVESSEP